MAGVIKDYIRRGWLRVSNYTKYVVMDKATQDLITKYSNSGIEEDLFKANVLIFNKVFTGIIRDDQFAISQIRITNPEHIINAPSLCSKEDAIHKELVDLLQWFKSNPPAADGSNFEERRAKSGILDVWGFQVNSETWLNYYHAKASIKAPLENQYPILQYLQIADQSVIEEIKATKVTEGVRIWKMYNMGLIVKTPDTCFGIDINEGSAQNLAKLLDFAVFSHWHPDHTDGIFFNEMKTLKKPVYGPSYNMTSPRLYLLIRILLFSGGP